MERIGKSIIVGCMDNILLCFLIKGKKLWIVYFFSNIFIMSFMDYKVRGFKVVMVVLSNGEVRIYKEKYFVNIIKMLDVVIVLKFGRFGREDSVLIFIIRSGGLYVKILKRIVNFEGKDMISGLFFV